MSEPRSSAQRADSGQSLEGARRETLGRYLVLGRVGAGAMGLVLAAYDPDLDRKVALKLVRPRRHRAREQARLRARLGKEARAIAKVSHPNLVSIYDVGVHGDQVFLAMEFLGGGTLRDWLRGTPRPERSAIVSTFVAIGRGLAAAHAQGLIHRDLKPENVLLDASGRPKVADFGLARLVRLAGEPEGDTSVASLQSSGALPGVDTNLTATGSIAGTPAYMAPEQFTAGTSDARSDQFAFCVALYEALYGERPFAGVNVLEIASAVLAGAVRPAVKDAEVPSWLRTLVLRGLSLDPDNRFPSMDHLVEVLSRDPVAELKRRLLKIAAGVLLLTTLSVALFGALSRRQEIERAVTSHSGEARSRLASARSGGQALTRLRTEAFARFDGGDAAGGEAVWAQVLSAAEQIQRAFSSAAQAAERAFVFDSTRPETRALIADVIQERLTFEQAQTGKLDAEALERLRAYDEGGGRLGRLLLPARLRIESEPAGARVSMRRFDTSVARYGLSAARDLGRTPISLLAVPPGSYVLIFESADRAPVTAAVKLDPGEQFAVALPLPRRESVPPGFVHVPAGRFVFGSAENDDLRRTFLKAPPLHAITTGAFLIARREVTWDEWLSFLRALPPGERRRRTPKAVDPPVMVELRQREDGRYQLKLGPHQSPYQAVEGESLRYRDREHRRQVDWRHLPVTGVSLDDAQAYAQWLQRTGQVPGARLCDEREWERAARGADGRLFPHGDRAEPDDFNHDVTYGRRSFAFGPDEVGSHPASRSPFGVDDLAGNVWEWVLDGEAAPFLRGGGWYHGQLTSRSNNREAGEKHLRNAIVGMRLCATVQH